MSNVLRGTITAALCVLVVVAWIDESRAEVSARTDRRGNYLATEVNATPGWNGNPGGVWAVGGRGLRKSAVLNPDGDVNGDRWPEIADAPVAPYHPWVVWSRFDGSDFDLAWSRWTTHGWDAIRWVEPRPTVGDDLDPDLTFDGEGRPYAVWSRHEDGQGKIYLSVFLVHEWMAPYLVSDTEVNSWAPTVSIDQSSPNQLIEVQYHTPEGTVSQSVSFSRPVSIRDDINPQVHMHLEGEPVYLQEGEEP